MNSFKALNSIAAISSTIGKSDRINVETVNAVVDNIVGLLDLEDFLIYQADPANKTLKQLVGSENKRSEKGNIEDELTINYSRGIVGSVAQNKKGERISNTSADHRYIVDDEIRFSELAVPIVNCDTVIGVLDSEHSAKGYFSDTHVQAFTVLGQLLVPMINQLRKIEMRGPNYYFQEFIRLLEEEKIYKDETISLLKVSQILDIHPTYLSKIISHESSSNFTSILNRFRVDEVKKMLVSEQYKNLCILGVAFEAGFNSKATFNRAFKKETSLSPLEFRKSHKEVSKV